jgi:pilus assembly protein CpaB
VVGKTATLELKPEQSETLARARQSGTLSLALRSLVDAKAAPESPDDEHRAKRDSINVVRFGVSTTTTTQK